MEPTASYSRRARLRRQPALATRLPCPALPSSCALPLPLRFALTSPNTETEQALRYRKPPPESAPPGESTLAWQRETV